jgi:hypothetical protein
MIGREHIDTIGIRIEVPGAFQQYVADAVVRFLYIHPAVSVETLDSHVCISATAAEAEVVKRDFRFCLFRQKIYAETLSLRTMLFEGVLGR